MLPLFAREPLPPSLRLIKARELLAAEGFKAAVIDMHTVKPLDTELVKEYAQKCKAMLTCENHQINNGLGSAVAEYLMESGRFLKFKRIGIENLFCEVGTQSYLQERFGLTAKHIAEKALAMLK